MKPLAAVLPVLALTTGVLAAADVTGRVVLKGTPKPEVTIDMAADPRCAALHTKPVTTRHYVVGADGGLANVFVYIKEGVKEKNLPLPAEVPILDQKDWTTSFSESYPTACISPYRRHFVETQKKPISTYRNVVKVNARR